MLIKTKQILMHDIKEDYPYVIEWRCGIFKLRHCRQIFNDYQIAIDFYIKKYRAGLRPKFYEDGIFIYTEQGIPIVPPIEGIG
jgi:hypothetical protein